MNGELAIYKNKNGRLFIIPSHYPAYHGWVFICAISIFGRAL